MQSSLFFFKIGQSAVNRAVLNDDPDTLQAILDCGRKNSVLQEFLRDERPMIHACVANSYRCIRVLYR